jgi:hypothetical protein
MTRTEVPRFLGLPGGMGRHPVGQTADSGVWKIGTNGSGSAPDTVGAWVYSQNSPSGRDRRIGQAVTCAAATSEHARTFKLTIS